MDVLADYDRSLVLDRDRMTDDEAEKVTLFEEFSRFIDGSSRNASTGKAGASLAANSSGAGTMGQIASGNNKRLFLHFGTAVDEITVPLANGNKRLSTRNIATGDQKGYRANDVISALGFSEPQHSWVEDAIHGAQPLFAEALDGAPTKPTVVRCGWADGSGGNLGFVKTSAKAVATEISQAYRNGKFDNGASFYSHSRLPLNGHSGVMEANTLRYLLDGNVVHNRDHLTVAQAHVRALDDDEDGGGEPGGPAAAPTGAATGGAGGNVVPSDSVGVTTPGGGFEVSGLVRRLEQLCA